MQPIKYVQVARRKNWWKLRYKRTDTTVLPVKNDKPCLKNDKSIVGESADKGSAVVVWDREDYINEVTKQLGDSDAYEEVPDDPARLINVIHRTKRKIKERGDLKKDTVKHFEVKDPNLLGSICYLKYRSD